MNEKAAVQTAAVKTEAHADVQNVRTNASCCAATGGVSSFLIPVKPCDKYSLAAGCFDSCLAEEILIPDLFKETPFTPTLSSWLNS